MTKKSAFKPLHSSNQINTKRDSGLESLLNSEHTVEIEKMAIGGDGVARIQYNQKSLVVFISKSAPKDILKIKISATEKNYLLGVILEVITPGPSRRVPLCTYALHCGGCSWQQFNEVEQLLQKESLLKELFKKSLPEIKYILQPTVASPKPFNYRNRIQLKHLGQQLGYFRHNTHEIVDIDHCPIADERISSEIKKIKETLKPSLEVQKYELKINQDNNLETMRIGEKGQGLSFSQVNLYVNELLVASVIKIAKQFEVLHMTELYAGSGNFSFEFIHHFPQLKLEAVELNPILTQAAAKKTLVAKLQKRLTFFTADCDSFVNRRSLSQDLILLDPPRAGCSDSVLEKVRESGCKNILYVSCHPVSLLRDLQKLSVKEGLYSISWLQIFDMFPQTDHFETLVWLTKNQI